VFEGVGFGVGLTMVPLDLMAEAVYGPHDPDRRPTRLGEMLPPAARSEAELGAEFGRVNAADSQLWAYRVELIVDLAARRPAGRDRQPGTPGAASPAWAGPESLPDGVSEFVPDEIAMLMNCSRAEATTLTCVAWTLHQRLPDTLAALADGELSWSRARAIAQEIHRAGPDLDPHAAETVEAVVLPQAADLPVNRLRAVVRKELLRFDADAAERRRRQAEAAAGVFLRRTTREGMSEVVTVLPHAVGAAMVSTVDALAREAKAAGDPRPIGVIRAEVSANLTLRPWDESRPPVSPQVRILAPINSLLPDPSHPAADGVPQGVAEVEGEPVTSAHLRALLEAVDAVCPGGLQPPTGGSLFFDLLGAGGGLLATLTRAELEAAARRGCPQHPAGDCPCALVGRPPATTAYEPTTRQRRFLSARDHGCRQPGCPNRTGWADLDHVHPHAEGGATDCDNLCCLCRRHHRLKTHAPGWSFHLDADGALLVTTPTGVTRVSRPPGSFFMEPYEFGESLPDADFYDLAPF
jgi:Domain of unknown function (DUF222)